jgi:hypothetical protein
MVRPVRQVRRQCARVRSPPHPAQRCAPRARERTCDILSDTVMRLLGIILVLIVGVGLIGPTAKSG